jgi:hypothetical protein
MNLHFIFWLLLSTLIIQKDKFAETLWKKLMLQNTMNQLTTIRIWLILGIQFLILTYRNNIHSNITDYPNTRRLTELPFVGFESPGNASSTCPRIAKRGESHVYYYLKLQHCIVDAKSCLNAFYIFRLHSRDLTFFKVIAHRKIDCKLWCLLCREWNASTLKQRRPAAFPSHSLLPERSTPLSPLPPPPLAGWRHL